MNDDELITAVREQRNKIPMTTPVEQVISRGRAVRARRRIPGLAAALTVAAAAAVTATTLAPTGHQASHQPTAQLAAWTVTRQPDGGVRVTLHELPDPARLQQKLRADGIPAKVFSNGHQVEDPLDVPGCHVYPLGGPGGTALSLWQKIFYGPHLNSPSYTFWVYPSAIPRGRGVVIVISIGPAKLTNNNEPPGTDSGYGVDSYSLYLVTASPRCTGS
jgi:hypothetical protein